MVEEGVAETNSVQNTSMILDEQATDVTESTAGTGMVVATAVAMGESDIEEADVIMV